MLNELFTRFRHQPDPALTAAAIPWTEVPALIAAHAAEVKGIHGASMAHYEKWKEAGSPTSAINPPEVRIADLLMWGVRERASQSEFTDAALADKFPAHHRLSALLDAVIVESVRVDRKIVDEVFTSRAMSTPAIYATIHNWLRNRTLKNEGVELIDALIEQEDGASWGGRAGAASALLQKILSRQSVEPGTPHS